MDIDKQALLNPIGWLTDSIMNAAQKLLKKQFPCLNSLQDVVLGNMMSFEWQPGSFVQILFCNSHRHWVTISCDGGIDPCVNIFDSVYDYVPAEVKAQIAALLFTQQAKIEINIMDVQKQVSIDVKAVNSSVRIM